ACRAKLLSNFGKLAAPTDEARRLSRQVAGPAGGPGHADKDVTTGRSYRSVRLGTGSVIPPISTLRQLPSLRNMTRELPVQRVEVSFVGAPPAQQVKRASGVSAVEIDGATLRCLV